VSARYHHAVAWDGAFEAHQKYLWGLCYRMTGSGADADELVQDTFVRALEHPPSDTERALRPWLTRVAMNLARDRLRRRKREPYVGTWLPEPIVTDGWDDETPDGRYQRLESLTFAFLLALETLNVNQRAVLLLRDVYELSVREVATTLELSESNVKVTHHRARKAIESYEGRPTPPSPGRLAATQRAMAAFLSAATRHDVEGMKAALGEDVVVLTDSAGKYQANRKPVFGRHKVAVFMDRIQPPDGFAYRTQLLEVNGLLALWLDFGRPPKPRRAERSLVRVDVDDSGAIVTIHSVMADAKLERLRRVLP